MSQVDAIRTRMKDIPAYLAEIIDGEYEAGAADIAAEAKQRAPGNFGILKNEIGYEKTADMDYEVFSRTMYSAYVEFGTRTQVYIPTGLEEYAAQFIGSPGATNLSAKEAIFLWCKEKGIEESAWYPIFVTLMTKGQKPHPFFFPAVDRQLPLIVNRIVKALVNDAFKNLQP